MNQKHFALIGAAGYIAPKHLYAIKETGNILDVVLDKNDSVGILDSYFPDADFFTEFERFDRHIEKLKLENKKIDYVSICSPNYLHDAHVRFSLRIGADAICEKPLVINPWNLDALEKIEQKEGQKINTIMQLRLNPSLIKLKEKIDNSDKIYNVILTYITSRGKWYNYSWKGDSKKSGGIIINIGIHFFDILQWLFGEVKNNVVHILQDNKASGYLEMKKANILWFLSTDKNDLPNESIKDSKMVFRSIKIDGEEIEFSNSFTELHFKSYKNILEGKGFGIKDVRSSIQLTYEIKNRPLVGFKNDFHPFCLKNAF